MVFAVTGDMEPEQMLRAFQKHLDDAPPGRVPSRTIEEEPPVTAPRTAVATFPKLGQAKVKLGFPSVKLTDPDLFALDLMSTILGGGESSILVEDLRDKRRLVTAIGASDPTPTYVEGTFEIDMELDPDKIGEATDAVLDNLDAIIKDGIPEERIQRAKVQMRAARVRGLQTSESMGASLATDFINTGDLHFTDRYLKRIDQVTNEELKTVAKKYFARERMITTSLVPAEFVGAEGLPKAEELLRRVAPTTKDSTQPETKSTITRVELPNGTILLHKRISTIPLVEIKMYSLGGLSEESKENNGVGNLAMQMLPRGTKTRKASEIAAFFDSIGGTLSTSCGNNSWSWMTTCLKDDFEKSMEVFADVALNPTFPDDELTRMKKRVVAAIESQDADWHTQAMKFFKAKYFGPLNSPYQFLAIGLKENVEKMSRDDLDKWYRDRIIKSRRVLAIFGDVDLEKAKSVAMERLGGGDKINVDPPTTQIAARSSERAKRPTVVIERVEVQKTEQPLSGVVIGYRADPIVGDPANYPIAAADTMCSGYGYPTGYLHEILRGRGLVYVVHAVNQPGRSAKLPGTFLAYAGCDPAKAGEVIDIMLENIARLQGTEKDMQPGWFERSKELCITSDALSTETPGEQATTAAVDELMGLGYDYHDHFAPRIGAVKLDDVRNVAGSRLVKCVITVCTPMPEAIDIKVGTRTYREFPPVDLTPKGVQHDTK
jgi:zinc protease